MRKASTLRRCVAGLALAAAVMPSGCAPQARADLAQHQFRVGEHDFAILLPSDFQRDSSLAFPQFRRPDHRVPRFLTFESNPPPLADLPRAARLRRGGELRYNVVPHAGGGSGGTEAVLVGHVTFGSVTVGVAASDQDELSPDPEWCIEFLHTLRLQ